ncbi:MAG: hypothetical protein WCQ70_01630 [Lentimicrobiaceae bacterium]
MMKVKYFYRILFSLLCIQLGLYIFSLFGREVDIDDAWLGEHAYFMAKDGHVHSELMRGWDFQEDRVLIHHKLMTLLGVVFINTLGFSVYSLKAVSLVFFILFLAAFYYIMVRWKKALNHRQFIIASFLIFTFHYTFKFSFLFRPEIIIMFLVFISWYLLEITINSKRTTWHVTLITGILGGLCVVAHLNGVAVVLAGGILLLWNRKWNHIIPYSLGVIIGLSLYFYDFNSEYGFLFWKNQLFQSVLGNDSSTSNIMAYMANNLLKEHMRFFHNPSIIGFSLLFFTLLTGGFKYLKINHRIMLQYTFLLWLFVALVFTQKSRQYILIYFPFFVFFMTLILDKLINNMPGLANWIYRKPSKIMILLLAIFYLVSTSYYNIQTAKSKFIPDYNRALSLTYFPENHATLNIVAPMEFIFNEITYFHCIQGERLYTTLKAHDKSICGAGFLTKTREFDIDYIILSPPYRRDLGMQSLKVGDTLAHFRVLCNTHNMIILKYEPAAL